MTGTYRIGELNIQIDSLLSFVHEVCADYKTDECPDVRIKVAQEDFELEKRGGPNKRRKPFELSPLVSDGYIDALVVYRKIAELMPERETFLLHGSAIAVDGECFIFSATSGTGKSTHAALWRKMLGERAVMVNDDKPLIRLTDKEAIVYGTPWCGKHRLGNNISVPLKAICMLERGTENSIRKIEKTEVLPLLLQQVYRPNNPLAMAKTMELINRLNVKYYRLKCNMDIAAAELSYNTMKG